MEGALESYQVADYLASALSKVLRVGRTVIEKPESHRDVAYAISLLQVKRDLEKLIALEKEHRDRV